MMETISAQVPIPTSLYDAIAQRAKVLGHSIDQEIITLLTTSLQLDELDDEVAAWEAASDEDWLSLESGLISEVA
jgi:hypothetical protein